MQQRNDVHQQFAEYFPDAKLHPYLYLLSKKLSDGHICIDINNINKFELEESGYTLDKKALVNQPLISNGNGKTPFILLNNKLYFERYFNYETVILNRILQFIQQEKKQVDETVKTIQQHTPFIKAIFGKEQSGQTNWQLVAALTAVLNHFTIITGGPGTGKTTTVAKILAILYTINPNLKVALTAPTGKAATRMAESLKNTVVGENAIKNKFQSLEPSTIHRLLGSIKNNPHFKHHSENPLNADLIIADESSMIDVALFAKLLDAVGPDTKLIMLGDKDQLASVEAGSLFGDLCQAQTQLNVFSKERATLINSFISNKEEQIHNNSISESTHPLFQHIIELQKSHRFSDEKGIGKFSKSIIHNNEKDIRNFFLNNDAQVTIDIDYSEKIFQNFIKGYEIFIGEPDIKTALQKLNALRVLCAVREGEQGLYAINKKIEKLLHNKKLIYPNGNLYANRPIMVTTNNRELQLFNGDIGIIRPDENGILKAWFENGEGEIRSVLPGYISDAETVFAMTIHKSQGSEFNRVLVVLPEGDDIKLLTRELLYTAVTRAKQEVIIQASEKLILQTANAIVHRGSGIIKRFTQVNK